MKSRNTKAIASICVAAAFAACSLPSRQIKAEQGQPAGGDEPQWESADLTSLPLSDHPAMLANLADALCTWPAPYGQKRYAMRLAAHALSLDKKNKAIALIHARASFFAADIAPDESLVAKFAEDGVSSARLAGINKDNPKACYYFALNQGLILQRKGLLALSKLPEVAEALKMASAADSIDWGGPLRVLGMLYLKAPAWPTGIGDLDKSLNLLAEAVKKYPVHPLNHIFYAEALIEDDNKVEAKKCLDIAERLAVPEIWGPHYATRWQAEISRLRKKTAD